MTENGQTDTKHPHHPHDKGYKQLLTNKKTFLELIRTFVQEEWVNEIDEDRLILVDKSYVLEDFSEKEADVVYRLRMKERDVIFYILLELQSTVDFLMPFRLLQYMVQIWRETYNNTPKEERERKGFRLPAIVPAVLYNGKNSWSAKMNFREMLADHEKFGRRVLDFSYILFNVNGYSDQELYEMTNLISSVFLLDQTMTHKELISRLRKSIRVLRKLTPDEFRQFIVWLKNVIKPKMSGQLQKEIDRIMEETNQSEVEFMIMNLEVTLDEMQQQAEARGVEKGKAEGLKEGELRKAIDTARVALKKGFSIDDIVEITGLDKNIVQKLKNELN
jgi:predicted transposase/invertase (TIGR01784 family)